MKHIYMIFFTILCFFFQPAWAEEGDPTPEETTEEASEETAEVKEVIPPPPPPFSSDVLKKRADDFIQLVQKEHKEQTEKKVDTVVFSASYKMAFMPDMAPQLFKKEEAPTEEELQKSFAKEVTSAGIHTFETVQWESPTELRGKEGFEIRGKAKITKEEATDPDKWTDVFIHFKGNLESKEEARDLNWTIESKWHIVDISTRFDWKKSKIEEIAETFVMNVSKGKFSDAYTSASPTLRELRTLENFTTDMQEARFEGIQKIEWDSAIPALPANGGYKLRGNLHLSDSTKETPHFVPIYLHLKGDASLPAEKRLECTDPTKECDNSEKGIAQWNGGTEWTVLDYRSADSMSTRWTESRLNPLDNILLFFSVGLLIGFFGLIFYYIRGLQGAPRELYLLYFTKVTEYSAYGAAASIMVPFLQNDVMWNGSPLGDSNGYLYYTVWTLASTVITIMVGAVCDTIGVKKCLMIGAVALLVSRGFTPLTTDIYLVTLFGFIPLAIGFAITGPVLKVGIKKFTTMKQSTLGFGLFYTLMNVGFAIGAEIADYFRDLYGDSGTEIILGHEFTTYQIIILIGFILNIPDFIAIFIMRDGSEMTENGLVLAKEKKVDDTLLERLTSSRDERRSTMYRELSKTVLASSIAAIICFIMVQMNVHLWKINVVPVGKYMWAFVATIVFFAITGVIYAGLSILGTYNDRFDVVMKSVRDATQETIRQLKENFQERPFWIYMGMLAILIFVRLTFYIFHLMFPTYAIRVFGADFPVASIFGTLNPVMIIFLVPLISALTINVRSYTMLLWGTGLSAASVFLCFLPESVSLGLANTSFGTWVFDYWLEAPMGNQDPFLISLVIFIMVFTVGEAIWSPRLMQFSAEIAPRGKEGAYIALAMLPYFLGKAGAGVLSEQMTTRYFTDNQVFFPSHDTAWLWIGCMAAISPIGLLIFRGVFAKREKEAIEEAKLFAEEQKKEEESQ
jgi:MFS family permease